MQNNCLLPMLLNIPLVAPIHGGTAAANSSAQLKI